MTSTRKPLFQLGMAEMIAVLSIFTVVFGAMWAPALIFQVVLLLVMVLIAIALAMAFSGRGDVQVFSQAFCAWTVVYLLAFVTMESRLYIFESRPVPLPTTVLWGELQPWVTEFRYRPRGSQTYSDEVIRGEDGKLFDPEGNLVGRMRNGRASGQIRIETEITPTSDVFYATGQILWVLGLGYLIGKFVMGFRRHQENRKAAEFDSKEPSTNAQAKAAGAMDHS